MSVKDCLIIFDMDNTLLGSRIDFARMKAEACRLLHEAGLEPDESWPVAQILNNFTRSGQLNAAVEQRVWQAICDIEAEGLAGALPEPGVEQVLAALAPYAHLALLTNTNQQAAQAAIAGLGLDKWFTQIMGRGEAPELKPAPGGMLALLQCFPGLQAQNTVAVGDALIDIRAARAAGMRFCAYNRSRAENWQAAGLLPELQLTAWDEDSAARLLNLAR